MKFNIYQKEVDDWINTIGIRYFSELTNMAILTEEVGELARLISRIYGEQSFKVPISEEEAKNRMADEMADIIFVVTCLANQTGVNLEDALVKNFHKKTNRDKDRHKSNEKLK